MKIIDAVENRRSVRTFDIKKELNKEVIEDIKEFADKQTNPYNLMIEWKILERNANKLSSPVLSGERYYIVGKMKKDLHAEEAFGYEFEEIILYLTTLGIGTTWMAGTMHRADFEKAVELKDDEIMPCVSPLGYPNKKMSLKEKLMRKGIKADTRKDFNELFFSKNFNTFVEGEELNKYKDILNLVRLAPSAVNKQPWRLLIDGNNIHFYKMPSKGFKGDGVDIQKVDIGIAMNHFIQGLKEKGIDYSFNFDNPNIECGECEYISTIIVK